MPKISLDANTRVWVYDRIDNAEGLYYTEFIKFMKDLGVSDRTINKYKKPSYKGATRRFYNKYRK